MIRWIMFYFYVLRLRGGKLYYGSTGDLRARVLQHYRGRVKFTSWNRPVQLVYFEEYTSAVEARERERVAKNHGIRRKTLIDLILEFPPSRLAGFVPAHVRGT